MALLCSFFRRFSPVFAPGTWQKIQKGLNFFKTEHHRTLIIIKYYFYLIFLYKNRVQLGVRLGCSWGAILLPGCNPHRAAKRLHPDEAL